MGPAIPAFSPLRGSQPSSFSANSPGEPSRLLKLCLQAAQKDSEARRAKNRQGSAYIGSTLTRGD